MGKQLRSSTKSISPITDKHECTFCKPNGILEDIKHQGISAFNSDTNYTVFRNVKDYGAKGDGVTDDTAAINLAISSGNRCGPGTCQSSTLTPAVVYFPAGTYIVSSSIIDYYFIGNANCPPTLKAAANFTGLGVIDGDQYGANGLKFGATNIFWRQVRNFIIDLKSIPANTSATGIHWPTAACYPIGNWPLHGECRGLYVESNDGVLWLYGTAVEHHSKYQYQFANTQAIVMGQIQTETPYYQPDPDAGIPFPTDDSLNDPVFVSNSSDAPAIANVTDNVSDAWGLRILNSQDLNVYGAGLYSFFDDYSTNCSATGNGEVCQRDIFSVSNCSGVSVYNLNTVGATYQITLDGSDEAFYLQNVAGFADTVALFRSSGGGV